MRIVVDGVAHELDVEDDMPLLWVLRDELDIKGVKFGCGIAQCGACTVVINGEAVKSCQMAVGDVEGEVLTIEAGLADIGAELGRLPTLRAVQAAWIAHQVAQCGYCQSGQIMLAAAFLAETPDPTDDEIDEAMSANLCRCGTYPRIRAAVKAAAQTLKEAGQ